MNYVGKPLAYILSTPERCDDAENPLRAAFGNEANEKDIGEFSRRFGVIVEDGFGSTRTRFTSFVNRECPAGLLAKAHPR